MWESIIEYVQCNPALCIQTVATVASLGVTLVYVIFTSRLVHTPHLAFLQPEKVPVTRGEVNPFGSHKVRIRNIGLGVANFVEVYVRVRKLTECYGLKCVIRINEVTANGASMIKCGSEELYEFDGAPGALRIEWRLATGKKEKCTWLYDEKSSKFLINEGMRRISYCGYRIWEAIMSPYYRQQRLRLQKDTSGNSKDNLK